MYRHALHRTGMRRFFLVAVLLLGLVATLPVTAASAAEGRASLDRSLSSDTSFSGQDLFRGLYLARGPVSERLGSHKLFTPPDRSSVEFEKKLLSEAERAVPALFEALEKAVASGDTVYLAHTLDRIDERLAKIVRRVPWCDPRWCDPVPWEDWFAWEIDLGDLVPHPCDPRNCDPPKPYERFSDDLAHLVELVQLRESDAIHEHLTVMSAQLDEVAANDGFGAMAWLDDDWCGTPPKPFPIGPLFEDLASVVVADEVMHSL